MLRRLPVPLLFFLSFTSFSQLTWQPVTASDTIITVTYRADQPRGKKDAFKGRLQFLQASDSQVSKLLIHQFNRLPVSVKKIKIVTPDGKMRITREELLNHSKKIMDKWVIGYLANNLDIYPGLLKNKGLLKNYPINHQRFFEGKSGGPFFQHNWIELHSTQLGSGPANLYVKGSVFRKAHFRTDTLAAGFAYRLPVLDTMPCKPINRFHEIRKMKGYGIDKFKYIRYQAPDRDAVSYTFEVYFDKNSALPDAHSLKRLVDFLRNNNYSILSATIEGYSSPEGTEELNTRLQQRRAQVLVSALQQHNNEIIVTDTVIIKHGYDLFRQSVQGTAHQWLDTLDNEALRTLINANIFLRTSLEPYLRQQRKATLKLVVAKRLEGEELFSKFKRDFSYWESMLSPQYEESVSIREVEGRLLGLIEYLFGLLETGQISPHQAAEVLDKARYNRIVRVLAVYHLIIQFEKKAKWDSLAWNKVSEKFGFNELFLVAQANLISLIQNPQEFRRDLEKFKQQLVDIQTYAFDYVMYDWLSIESLCNLDYPNQPVFRIYKLNQLAFLQSLSRYRDVPCEELTVSSVTEFKKYADEWIDSARNSRFLLLLADERHLPHGKYYPTYGKEIYSPYLYFLKKFFLSNETSIRQHIKSSDNLYEFDLYLLLYFNVTLWEPLLNYWKDKEVTLEELNKLVGMLRQINKHICTYQVNQLYLDYHLKALQYLDRYFEPGNRQHVRIAEQSLRYISQYYISRSALITPRLSLYILKQLNAFHWIPGQYDGTWYAWKILKEVAEKRELSDAEENLFSQYRKYYDHHKGRKEKNKPVVLK